MSTEIRFLLAVVLMIGVLVITNLLFPPEPVEEMPGYVEPDSALVPEEGPETAAPDVLRDTLIPPQTGPGRVQEEGEDPLEAVLREAVPPQAQEPQEAEATILVEGPLYSYTFSRRGARLIRAQLPDYPSFSVMGPVELVYPDEGALMGTEILSGSSTLDMRPVDFEVEPAGGLTLAEGGGPQSLRFTYQHPVEAFRYHVVYSFRPDNYVIDVSIRVESGVEGLDPEYVYTDLGHGIPFNEQREADEERAAAYVVNDMEGGVRSTLLDRVREPSIESGPFYWAAFKSKYFLISLLAGSSEEEGRYISAVIVDTLQAEHRTSVSASQALSSEGTVDFRLYVGPQEFSRLEALGTEMQNVNPYGWSFMRPLIRPFAGIIIKILTFLHQNLKIGYGWVLILFGVMMRIVLFPLNQKAMRAQMRNMAVQPLMQEMQKKYKDQPEKLQKEMMKLYKEHGFNPLAGCLPMLLPWPVLIALFFVFQNTIELRGVSFLWLPDLSAPDPLFILPVFLGISMFLLQWVSMRSMPQQNPQMKMMMYLMPIMMVAIFFQLASGLNLYYATANIATLPQQIWIAKERRKAQAKAAPLTMSS
jgi:YidC/Oxa1 family membrane protein insertase